MTDFRKWCLAAGAVALLLGMSSTAYAQVSLTPSFQCVANAGNPTIVRVEGLTELVGDYLLNCTGGTPTANGAPIPVANVTIILNTNITGRLVSGNVSEATLMIDEPHPAPAVAVPDNAVVLPPAGSPPQILCTPQGSACPEVGKFTGVPSPSPYQTQPNVFSGLQASANSVLFLGVPIDAPGTAGVRVIRITNVRANAFQLGLSSTLIPTQITMFVAVYGAQQMTLNNPTQTVAFIQRGLVPRFGDTVVFTQCGSHNASLIGGTGTPAFDFNVSAAEGFSSSFKRREVGLTSDGATAPQVFAQNVPGFPYNTESDFYAPALSPPPGVVPIAASGLADFGTRIRLRFNNVVAGVHLFVPISLPLTTPGGSTSSPPQPQPPVPFGISDAQIRLVQADFFGGSSLPGYTSVPATATVQGLPVAEVNYGDGMAWATYEIVNSDPNVPELATIPVAVAFNSTASFAFFGEVTVNVSEAPSGGFLDSYPLAANVAVPIPRFEDTSSAQPVFTIDACSVSVSLSAVVVDKGQVSPGVRFYDVKITNQGFGSASGVEITQLVLSTLNGIGTVTNMTTLPVVVGDMAAGSSQTVRLTLGVPATVTRFRLGEKGNLQNSLGQVATFSLLQAVFP